MRRVLAIGTLLACAVVAASIAPTSSRSSTKADCSLSRTGLIPLTDMGKRKYRGHRGGLYPSGVNRPPPKYLRRGTEAAKRIRPIDGKIVLLSIGMSNASDEFAAFKRSADRDPQKNATRAEHARGPSSGRPSTSASPTPTRRRSRCRPSG